MNELSTLDIPVTGEVSANQDDLNAKIDQELGLTPPAEEKSSETAEDTEKPAETTEPEPGEPAGEEDAGEAEPAEEIAKAEPATPSDSELFIEVEDGDGVTHKISQIEDLPEDFTPKNNRQIIEIVSQLAKLDTQREADAAKAAEDAEVAAITEAQTQQFKSWDAEIAELDKQKRFDGKDGDKANEVFGYMNEINAARTKAGNPNLITSFEDALEKYEAKQARDTEETGKKNDTERAKQKSGLIGKSSAAAGGDHYVYRAGSARNIDDIPL